MKNFMRTSGFSPLGIYISGSGEYVRNQLLHLQDYFDMVEYDELESIRQSYEDLI